MEGLYTLGKGNMAYWTRFIWHSTWKFRAHRSKIRVKLCHCHAALIKLHIGLHDKNCYNFTASVLVIRHVVLFAYLLDRHNNLELARTVVSKCKFRDRQRPIVQILLKHCMITIRYGAVKRGQKACLFSTICGKSTCSEVRKFKNKCAKPQCNAMLKISFFTAWRKEITNTINRIKQNLTAIYFKYASNPDWRCRAPRGYQIFH